MFRNPQDVAVDADRTVYVADTGNHCIRRISNSGHVTTVAGTCGEAGDGYADGNTSHAKFSSPSGISVYYDWSSHNATGSLVLFVADTDNHRIRRIDCIDGTRVRRDGPTVDCKPTVSCFAGRCGNGTRSYTASRTAAPPEPGFADGPAAVARFDSPRGLEADADGTVYVADTNNHLIRAINATGWVFTLAGHVVLQQE